MGESVDSEPTPEPTVESTPEPTVEPTSEPTPEPTPEIIFHTVKFVSDNNTIKTSSIADGEIIGGELPAAPTKVGFRFVRWVYIDNISNNIEVTANTIVTGDMTVAAQYIQQRTVSIDVDGEINTVTVDDGMILNTVLPENPTKEGYRFTGWSVDGDTPVTSDLSVEALFTKTWTVTFVADETTVKTSSIDEGESIGAELPEAPVKEGYRVYLPIL